MRDLRTIDQVQMMAIRAEGARLELARQAALKVKCLERDRLTIMRILANDLLRDDRRKLEESNDPLAYIKDHLPRTHYLFKDIGITWNDI